MFPPISPSPVLAGGVESTGHTRERATQRAQASSNKSSQVETHFFFLMAADPTTD